MKLHDDIMGLSVTDRPSEETKINKVAQILLQNKITTINNTNSNSLKKKLQISWFTTYLIDYLNIRRFNFLSKCVYLSTLIYIFF